MTPLLMPMDTWDTINTLCFNRKVLMVGVADGHDVVAIAQVAMIAAVYVEIDTANPGVLLAKTERVGDIIRSRELGSRVLLHAVPALLGITQYAPAQFDVAVYNPGVCADPDPAGTVAQLATYAGRVVVVGDAIPELWDTVTGALEPGGYTASSDHSAIFITLGAPEPIVTVV